MPSLETPIKTVTNDQVTGIALIPINNRVELGQGEQVTLPINNTRNSTDISQLGVSEVLIPSGTHEAELQCRLNKMEDLIRQIPRMPAPIKNSSINSYVDSLFTDNIALAEMPCKFSFQNMKLYNGTTDLDERIVQYK